MGSEINFNRSITKRRLIFKDAVTIADYIITCAGSLIFIFISSAYLIGTFDVMPLVPLLLIIIFISWMVANMLLFNRLVKVETNNDIITNRQNIIKILNEYFDLSIENNDQTIIRTVRLSGFIYWGRIITILLDGSAIYINIQSLGRGDIISFFHGFGNYLKSKRIKNRLIQNQ